MASPAVQGIQFEQTFADLLERLLPRLGLTDVELRRQPSGPQHGKDVQARWRDRSGRLVAWHFECKSHGRGKLPGSEIGDKVIDVIHSAHEIDVWCLTLAHVEPGHWIDETIPWINAQMGLSFRLEVLAPQTHAIKRLYACEPDLFRRQYPDEEPPRLRRPDVDAALETFDRFLAEATARAREQRGETPPAWELVVPERLSSHPLDPEESALYLRGLLAQTPWDAVFADWAVPRASTVEGLVDRVLEAEEGFDFAWLVGGSGEGKSAVMKQVAWRIASEHDDWSVLWTEAATRPDTTTIPAGLVRSASAGSKILLCVDGTEGLEGGRQLRTMADDLRRDGVAVFLLCADRGRTWNASPLPAQLSSHLRDRSRRIDLQPLTPEEARALVTRLEARGLLRAASVEDALARLRRGPQGGERPWLLPTLLELTDPARRGFEGILAAVLRGLRQEESAGPLSLLLSASVVQGAGRALPEELAERLVAEAGGLAATMNALTAELARVLDADLAAARAGRLPHVVVTHHRVLADAFVQIAARHDELAVHLVEACGDLAATVAPDVTSSVMIPPRRFKLLDVVGAYLSAEPPLYDAGERFLRKMIALDERQFPTETRLADLLTNRLREALTARPPDEALIAALAEVARAEHRRALDTARAVLGGEASPPRPLAGRKLPLEEALIYNEWAVLESTLGDHMGDTAALERAAVLAIRALASKRSAGYAAASLPRTLILLDECGLAARIVAARPDVDSSRKGHAVTRALTAELAKRDVAVPAGDIAQLGEVAAELATGRLLEHWAAIGLCDSERDHVELLLVGLRGLAAWLEGPMEGPLAEAIALLTLRTLARSSR